MTELDAVATLDLERAARRGYPEAVYCSGKTPEQVRLIAAAVRDAAQVTLFTRADAGHAAAVLAELPDAAYDETARLLAWPPVPPAPVGGLVLVVSAGTSDLPVAREALLTARYLGRETELVVDVGVAGLHRILNRLELLRRARVIVVAAGMDGALPGVVAGLVAAPVVALPTSVGYGAAFEGVAALLTMLNACAPGVGVVNIDNGYGAGHLAAQIAAPHTAVTVVGAGTVSRHAWIDASAGVAGDMLLGALVDAGADLAAVQACVDAVVPGAVRLTARPVLRAGQSGTKVEVEVLTDDLPERHWSEIEQMLGQADLPGPVHDRAHRTFARLAEAEAGVHGISVAQVHFHEVGALDSIADVVGVCAALHLLGVESLSAGPVAVGSGRIRTAHGDIGVPVPAVVRLATGWRVVAGGRGELATPTGMALVTALSERCEDLPALLLSSAGAGAGTKDDPDRANLTRILIGEPATSGRADPESETLTVLEANVDDLDPRLWPGVLARLLAAGARDAWLVPILMKKGRPAHTLAVLARPGDADELQQLVFAETTTLGVRRSTWQRTALERGWADVGVASDGGPEVVAVKVAHRRGRVLSATPEFAEVERAAARTGEPVRSVLERTVAAATAAGLSGGGAVPDGLRDTVERPHEPPTEPVAGA